VRTAWEYKLSGFLTLPFDSERHITSNTTEEVMLDSPG
jgi:hypothetical protein